MVHTIRFMIGIKNINIMIIFIFATQVQRENEEFEQYRNFDFSYVSKSYKLSDLEKGLKRKKKGRGVKAINPAQKTTAPSLPRDSNFTSF